MISKRIVIIPGHQQIYTIECIADMNQTYVDDSLLEQARNLNLTISPGEWPEECEVVVDGIKLHYLDWGKKEDPVILFLHGGAQTSHMWDFSALALRENYRCVALDQRGHGDSGWSPTGDYSLEAYQHDIEGFITALGIAPLILVGLSMGGQNAYVFAGNHTDWIKKLVIIDVGPAGETKGSQEIRAFVELPDQMDSYEDFVTRVQKFNHLRPAEQIRYSLKHNVMKQSNGKWTWKYDRLLRDPNHKIDRPSLEYLWDVICKISCPTLIVRGAESNVLSDEMADKMVACISDSKKVTIQKAGHRVPGDNPVDFERALVEFLNDK